MNSTLYSYCLMSSTRTVEPKMMNDDDEVEETTRSHESSLSTLTLNRYHEGQKQNGNSTKRLRSTLLSMNDVLPNPTVVDFDGLAQTIWGEQLLYKTRDADEISDLIGLATSLEGPHQNAVGDGDPNSQSVAVAQSPARDSISNNNPLLQSSFHNPPTASTLEYLCTNAPKLKKRRPNRHISVSTAPVAKAMDVSAYVAMGMTLEEIITASLLPLAGFHVLRCRAIQDAQSGEEEQEEERHNHHPSTSNDDDAGHHDDTNFLFGGPTHGSRTSTNTLQMEEGRDEDRGPSNDKTTTIPEAQFAINGYPDFSQVRYARHPITNESVKIDLRHIRWKDENVWDEWTIPPEEAIMKLLEQGMIVQQPKSANNDDTAGISTDGKSSKPVQHIDVEDADAQVHDTVSPATKEAAIAIESTGVVFGIDASIAKAHGEIFDIFRMHNKHDLKYTISIPQNVARGKKDGNF